MYNRNKRKNRFIVSWLWVLFPIVAFSHSPSQSSTILVEGKNNLWTLQIRTSLTAYEQVVHTAYTKEGYKTPEEFQTLMTALLSKNLHLKMDNKEITLTNPKIHLGHETIVVYEVVPPKDFKTVQLENTLFQDIYGSASSFMVLKNGVKRNLFKLDKKNNYNARVDFENGEFVLQEKSRGLAGIAFNWYVVACILGIGGAGMLAKSKFKNDSKLRE
ncbi:hypothetical protein N9Y48_00180 [Zobellia sp.]|nr:hypothetical protein [Zobellia sp.]